MKRTRPRGVGLVLLVWMGACAGRQQIVQPGTGTVVEARELEGDEIGYTASFAARVNARLDRAERALREDIRDGDLPPEALEAFLARRRQLAQTIQRYSDDGLISYEERARVEDAIDDLEDFENHYRGRAIGGGPH